MEKRCRAPRLPLTPPARLRVLDESAFMQVLSTIRSGERACGPRPPVEGLAGHRMTGHRTTGPESSFSTKDAICGRVGVPSPRSSTDVENPVDRFARTPCKTAFRTKVRSGPREALLYCLPPWSRSSTGCSPATRLRQARARVRLRPDRPRLPSGRRSGARAFGLRRPAHRRLRHADQPAARGQLSRRRMSPR